MNSTSIPWLVFTTIFCAAASAIIVWRFYGDFSGVSLTAAVFVWVLAVICVVLGRRVRACISDGRVGMDRSQVSPLTVSLWLVIAKASAWTGAIVGGAYLGVLLYVVAHLRVLDAAVADTPGALVSAVGGIALASAGVYLERGCRVPPPTDGAQDTHNHRGPTAGQAV